MHVSLFIYFYFWCWLLMLIVCRPITMLLYPLYASVVAIESASKEDDQQWLSYWILYSFLTLMEMLLQPLLEWYSHIYIYQSINQSIFHFYFYLYLYFHTHTNTWNRVHREENISRKTIGFIFKLIFVGELWFINIYWIVYMFPVKFVNSKCIHRWILSYKWCTTLTFKNKNLVYKDASFIGM